MELILSRPADVPAEPAWAMSEGFEALEPRVLLSTTDPDNTLVRFVTDYGAIVIELFDNITPVTVQNFLNYVTDGDYDDTIVHRSVPGFVIQAGGYVFRDNEEPAHIDTDPTIVNEHSLPNLARTIAMARLTAPDTASSEFFFNLEDNPNLDKPQNASGFAVFGKVVGGWHVVTTIAGLDTYNFGSLNPDDTFNGIFSSVFSDTPVTDAYTLADFRSDTVPPDPAYVHIQTATVIGTVGQYMEIAAGTILSSDQNDAGSLVVGGPNTNGSQTVFQRDPADGTWYVSALAVKNTRPGGVSTETFIDPKDGATYAAVSTDTGVLLYKNVNFENGDWFVRNISLEIGGLPNISGVMTSFSSPTTGLMYLAGLAQNGDLILLEQTGATDSNGNFVWTGRNLAATDLASNGMVMPQFDGVITSYTAPWNGLNIAGVDQNGDLHSIWWAPGLPGDLWQTSNLSEITGAPPLVGRVTPWVTSWNAINLVGTTAAGDVVATWWLPAFGGDWRNDNITALIDGPALVNNSIDSYFKAWGGQNIAGIDASTGDLVIYWWAPGVPGDLWQVANLSDIVGTGDLPGGAVSVASAPGGNTDVFFTTTNNEIVRVGWDIGTDVWSFENISQAANFI